MQAKKVRNENNSRVEMLLKGKVVVVVFRGKERGLVVEVLGRVVVVRKRERVVVLGRVVVVRGRERVVVLGRVVMVRGGRGWGCLVRWWWSGGGIGWWCLVG